MDYNAPSGSTDANAGYVGKTASTIGSKVPPKAAEYPQREVVAAEACAGIVPSNGDTTQLPQSIGRGLWIGTLGAGANALVGSIGGGAVAGTFLKTLNPWTRLRGIAAQTNTSVTVNVQITGVGTSGGSVAGLLKKRDGSAPSVGDVPVGFPFEIQYDGTNFRFVGSVASDSGSSAGGGSGSSFANVLWKATKNNALALSAATMTDVPWTGTATGTIAGLGTFDGVTLTLAQNCRLAMQARLEFYTSFSGSGYAETNAHIYKNGVAYCPGQFVGNGQTTGQFYSLSKADTPGDDFLQGDQLKVRAIANAQGYSSGQVLNTASGTDTNELMTLWTILRLS